MMADAQGNEPVNETPPASVAEESPEKLEDGIALCLSGGGYRAMLFHCGALLRLNEFGLLHKLRRVSSVSGGSILAATLGLHWDGMEWNGERVERESLLAVINAVRQLARNTLDASGIVWGSLNPFGTINDEIVDEYDRLLFRGATLQALPDERSAEEGVTPAPRFVLTATNVKTGSLWRFAKPYMADFRVGMVDNPELRLAEAVAASSAFPPVLSPSRISLEDFDFRPGVPEETVPRAFRSEALLTDGGVYDNLGLEPVWKRYKTILVSDGGRRMDDEASPADDWARHSKRLLDLLMHQTSSLRRRQLIGAYQNQSRLGTYWGIQTDIANYGLPATLPCPHEQTLKIAYIPTRLKALSDRDQERIMNWGFAVCDAAVRRHMEGFTDQSCPDEFPFPNTELE